MAHAELMCAASRTGIGRETRHDNILASESCHEDNSVPKLGRKNIG